jgi:hypothetical protein
MPPPRRPVASSSAGHHFEGVAQLVEQRTFKPFPPFSRKSQKRRKSSANAESNAPLDDLTETVRNLWKPLQTGVTDTRSFHLDMQSVVFRKFALTGKPKRQA